MSADHPKPPANVQELALPAQALEHGGYEVLRAVIADGTLSISLRRAFDEPGLWGMVLADVARHVGRIYADEASMREDDVIDKVWATFEAEMDRPTDATKAIS